MLRHLDKTVALAERVCGLGDASPKAEGDIGYFRSLLAEAGL